MTDNTIETPIFAFQQFFYIHELHRSPNDWYKHYNALFGSSDDFQLVIFYQVPLDPVIKQIVKNIPNFYLNNFK